MSNEQKSVQIGKLTLLTPAGATMAFMSHAAVQTAVEYRSGVEFEFNDTLFYVEYEDLIAMVQTA